MSDEHEWVKNAKAQAPEMSKMESEFLQEMERRDDAMNDVVERCGKAVDRYFQNDRTPHNSPGAINGPTLAVLSALRPGDELPGGLTVVRREPTERMLEAGRSAQKKPRLHVGHAESDAVRTLAVGWFAMLAAAKEEW